MSLPRSRRNSLCREAITPWPTNGHQPRRAAVSSYGMSGTNVHAVLEQAPADRYRRDDVGQSSATAGPLLFPLSATSADELRRTAGRLADWVASRDGAEDGTPCRIWPTPWRAGARTGRCARPCWPAASRSWSTALREVADGDTPYPAAVGQDDRGPVWVFSGQGSQWAGMGAGLLATEPVFAATVAEVEPLIAQRVRVLGDRGDVGARDGDRHRPGPADPVHHAGRAGGHDEVLRGAAGRGHRAFDGRGRGSRRRRSAVAGRRGARDLPPLAADVPHRGFRRDGVGGTACRASAFGTGGSRRHRCRGCRWWPRRSPP